MATSGWACRTGGPPLGSDPASEAKTESDAPRADASAALPLETTELAVLNLGAVPRGEFNRLAARAHVPCFWREDANQNGQVEPDEVVTLFGFGETRNACVRDGRFTPAFAQGFHAVAALYLDGDRDLRDLSEDEAARRRRTSLARARATGLA